MKTKPKITVNTYKSTWRQGNYIKFKKQKIRGETWSQVLAVDNDKTESAWDTIMPPSREATSRGGIKLSSKIIDTC